MRYDIKFTPKANKAFQKLEKPIQKKIAVAVGGLAADPMPVQSKKLVGIEGCYRVRVGDYRVIYKIENGELLVLVLDLGHRRDIYRK